MNSMTRWQQALEHNPADLSRNELWSVCVSVAMSFQTQGRTYQEFSSWYQWEWAATEKLGRRNNARKGKGTDLNKLRVGEPEETGPALPARPGLADRGPQHRHDRAAQYHRPSVRCRVEYPRTGSILLCVFDDMVTEMKRLNQASFTYPCRPAAKRLGISHMAVSRHLEKMIELGYIHLDRQGTAYEGRVDNLASVYSFASFASKTAIGPGPVARHPQPQEEAKKKPIDPCSVANLKKLDAAFGEPLTYQDVLANGGTVAHWKRWLRHLQGKPGQAAQGRRVLREAGDQGCPGPSPYRREG